MVLMRKWTGKIHTNKNAAYCLKTTVRLRRWLPDASGKPACKGLARRRSLQRAAGTFAQ